MRRSTYGPNALPKQLQGLAHAIPVTERHRPSSLESEPCPSGSAAASRLISSHDAASALYGPASFDHFFALGYLEQPVGKIAGRVSEATDLRRAALQPRPRRH